ncbi:hypothetical protein J6590_048222 [Homalodisca vitripennis]|nr:hypothetical protein J6590_048222 [Homalodisca vitripennis]
MRCCTCQIRIYHQKTEMRIANCEGPAPAAPGASLIQMSASVTLAQTLLGSHPRLFLERSNVRICQVISWLNSFVCSQNREWGMIRRYDRASYYYYSVIESCWMVRHGRNV